MPPKKKTDEKKTDPKKQDTKDDLADFEPDKDVQESEKTESKSGQGHVAIHSSGFRDFLLKPELLRSVVDAGFEHPSEVQHQALPPALFFKDILCQAKSGMGKTAVFVLALLQQIEPIPNQTQALILCNTRELAYQISKEFIRFSKYMPDAKVSVFFGGVNLKVHKLALQSEKPNIAVGTPGRILQLIQEKNLDVSKIKHFVIDECDTILDSYKMRKTVQEIFIATPKEKQVMMFTATLSKETREIGKKFMQKPEEIYVDDEAKLTLHGLLQYYIKLSENEKNRKLFQLLDVLEFNQVVIFVKTTQRAHELNKLLNEGFFPSICVHSDMKQEERIEQYTKFKNFEKRILVSTDVFGRGIDIERINIVINYDMAPSSDNYLHRVGRAGRFGTKGLAISFISTDATKNIGKYVAPHTDDEVLDQVQKRFIIKIEPLPEKIDVNSYMTA